MISIYYRNQELFKKNVDELENKFDLFKAFKKYNERVFHIPELSVINNVKNDDLYFKIMEEIINIVFIGIYDCEIASLLQSGVLEIFEYFQINRANLNAYKQEINLAINNDLKKCSLKSNMHMYMEQYFNCGYAVFDELKVMDDGYLTPLFSRINLYYSFMMRGDICNYHKLKHDCNDNVHCSKNIYCSKVKFSIFIAISFPLDENNRITIAVFNENVNAEQRNMLFNKDSKIFLVLKKLIIVPPFYRAVWSRFNF